MKNREGSFTLLLQQAHLASSNVQSVKGNFHRIIFDCPVQSLLLNVLGLNEGTV